MIQGWDWHKKFSRDGWLRIPEIRINLMKTSRDLSACDFHLYVPLKESLGGKHFNNDFFAALVQFVKPPNINFASTIYDYNEMFFITWVTNAPKVQLKIKQSRSHFSLNLYGHVVLHNYSTLELFAFFLCTCCWCVRLLDIYL